MVSSLQLQGGREMNTTTKQSFHILLVDHNFNFSARLARKLKQEFESLSVTWVSDPYSAMNHLMENYHDLVILDWDLSEMSGTCTLDRVDKALSMEKYLPLRWIKNKVSVTLLTNEESKNMNIRRSRKFFHVKRILSKKQPLQEIVDQLRLQIENLATAAG